MKLAEPSQAFVQLWTFLSGGDKLGVKASLNHLEEYFDSSAAGAGRETW
jgi:hypothetical protein